MILLLPPQVGVVVWTWFFGGRDVGEAALLNMLLTANNAIIMVSLAAGSATGSCPHVWRCTPAIVHNGRMEPTRDSA